MRLNIGSGRDYRDGWINLERYRESHHHDRETAKPDILADAHDLPFKDDTFKRVDAIHTLEHLQRPLEALKEMRRVSRSDGRVHILVPNPEVVIEHIGSERDEHLYSWTEWTLKNICEKAGLEVWHYYEEEFTGLAQDGHGHAVVATKRE